MGSVTYDIDFHVPSPSSTKDGTGTGTGDTSKGKKGKGGKGPEKGPEKGQEKEALKVKEKPQTSWSSKSGKGLPKDKEPILIEDEENPGTYIKVPYVKEELKLPQDMRFDERTGELKWDKKLTGTCFISGLG